MNEPPFSPEWEDDHVPVDEADLWSDLLELLGIWNEFGEGLNDDVPDELEGEDPA